MSPGDRSYDALGLMKQLSDYTAPTYADALEVLGNETPETLVKQRRANNPNIDTENSCMPQSQTESRSHLSSNILVCPTFHKLWLCLGLTHILPISLMYIYFI